MRSLILSALAAALFIGVTGTKCVAQAGAPPGDYQSTCRDIRDNNGQLTASCQNRNGQWRSTSLDYRNCQGSIVNDDGQLRCATGGSQTGGQQAGVPQGSYQQTCRNIRNNGPQLNASCQNKSGQWKNTSIDTRSCSGEIVNDDGNLRCSK
jgi:major membrane immunogen (membrane-anchored lipoprotein)